MLLRSRSRDARYRVQSKLVEAEGKTSNFFTVQWTWKLIPQACLMGFKAEIIDSLFSLWKAVFCLIFSPIGKHWKDWISPKPFAKYRDPNPKFLGSEFCIEQYALGFAINDFSKVPGKLSLFARSILCIESDERCDNS